MFKTLYECPSELLGKDVILHIEGSQGVSPGTYFLGKCENLSTFHRVVDNTIREHCADYVEDVLEIDEDDFEDENDYTTAWEDALNELVLDCGNAFIGFKDHAYYKYEDYEYVFVNGDIVPNTLEEQY